jgi:transposase
MYKPTKNIQMDNPVNLEMMYVGIDISKSKHSVHMCDYTRRHNRKPFFITNNRSGFDQLQQEVSQQMQQWNLTEVVFGLEPTGNYGKPLQSFLENSGYQVCCINPLHTKRWKVIEDNLPSKNDYKDSQIITSLLMLNKSIRHRNMEAPFLNLSNLAVYYYQLTGDLLRQGNHLEALNAIYFPELSGFFKSKDSGMKYIMENFALPEDIVKTGWDEFQKIMNTRRKGNFSLSKLQNLYAVAQTSIGLHQGTESVRVILQNMNTSIQDLKKQIRHVTEQIHAWVDVIEYGELLATIPGISKLSVGLFLAETGDIRKYDSAHDIIRLAGLHLVNNQSGKYAGPYHISKVGRTHLRTLLYNLVVEMLVNNPMIKQDYHRRVKIEKHNSMKSLIAICCKLIRIIYSMVKYNRPFDYVMLKSEIKESV